MPPGQTLRGKVTTVIVFIDSTKISATGHLLIVRLKAFSQLSAMYKFWKQKEKNRVKGYNCNSIYNKRKNMKY